MDQPNLRLDSEAVNLHMRSQSSPALIGLGESPGRGHHRHVIHTATSSPLPRPDIHTHDLIRSLASNSRTEEHHHLLIGFGRPAKTPSPVSRTRRDATVPRTRHGTYTPPPAHKGGPQAAVTSLDKTGRDGEGSACGARVRQATDVIAPHFSVPRAPTSTS